MGKRTTISKAENPRSPVAEGVGKDGVGGIPKQCCAGLAILSRDEAACVIYGMPGPALELGALEKVVIAVANGRRFFASYNNMSMRLADV